MAFKGRKTEKGVANPLWVVCPCRKLGQCVDETQKPWICRKCGQEIPTKDEWSTPAGPKRSNSMPPRHHKKLGKAAVKRAFRRTK